MNEISLIGIPKARLIALQWFDLDKIAKEETKFRKKWKTEKRCECVLSLEENQLPWCKHVKKALKKEKTYEEIKDKIWYRTKVLTLKSFSD